MFKKRFAVIMFALLAAFILLYKSQSIAEGHSMTTKKTGPYLHELAPEFTLKSLNGKTFTLEQAKGKPVVINFWASWCGPCNMEAPEFSQIYKKYKGQFVLYAINLTDTETSLKDVNKFQETYHFKFPVLLDPKGHVSTLYQIKPIPTTFFINSKGEIVDQIMGYAGKGVIEAKLMKVLQAESQSD